MNTFTFKGLVFAIKNTSKNTRVITSDNVMICGVGNYLAYSKVTKKLTAKDIENAFMEKCESKNISGKMILDYIDNTKKQEIYIHI